jgi:hypothetical protein
MVKMSLTDATSLMDALDETKMYYDNVKRKAPSILILKMSLASTIATINKLIVSSKHKGLDAKLDIRASTMKKIYNSIKAAYEALSEFNCVVISAFLANEYYKNAQNERAQEVDRVLKEFESEIDSLSFDNEVEQDNNFDDLDLLDTNWDLD